MKWVHVTIESIGMGTVLPKEIILWVDDPKALQALPSDLLRLRKRGLSIRLSENFGPHTKYFPFVEGNATFDGPLVTADDDILYPAWWLEALACEYVRTPDQVVCHRARRIAFDARGILPYASWRFVTDAKPSLANFATGVGGVIYPPQFLSVLKKRGRDFIDKSLSADDVWLHQSALVAGMAIRQISDRSASFPVINWTQGVGLKHSNVLGGNNDVQIAAVYSPEDIERLRETIDGELNVGN